MSHATIAALATPPGVGGIGIIRVSGSAVSKIAQAIIGTIPQPRQAVLHFFRDTDGTALDQGIVLFFPAPHSFTGEDVLEFQGHGGPVVLDLLLHRIINLGARLARPGEFSERAYLAGKLDLTQAEAVADLIMSSTATAARGAMRTLQGALSRQIHTLNDELLALRVYTEGMLDFPDEDIELLSDTLLERLDHITSHHQNLLQEASQGRLLRDGLTLVIAGAPNAGKSSLLNALAGRDTAIVTHLPGTTRDLLRESIQIEGMPVHVIDTAGLRETDDLLEREGIRRAQEAITNADRVLWVFDDQQDPYHNSLNSSTLPVDVPVTLVRNKIDITGTPSGLRYYQGYTEVAIAATSGLGLDTLRQHLKECVGYLGCDGGEFIARRRHLDVLDRVSHHLHAAHILAGSSTVSELLAEELRQAQNALGQIIGEILPEELLGEIFSTFCIGK